MAYERTLKDVENFVFDLDGTVWEWNRLKDDVKETIEELASRGKEPFYVTNNSILSREAAAEKLRKLGLDADRDHVITGGWLAAWALDHEDVRDVYLVGEDGLRTELEARNISHSDDAEHVLVGCDRNFSYWKLADAAELVRDGATLWATAPDSHWWGGDRQLPGTKALTDAVETAAGAGETTVLGKPSKWAREAVKREWRLRPNNTVLIGDSLQTDTVLGNKLGYKTALVLGGVSSEDDLNVANDYAKPHIVFREFSRILQKI